MAALRSDAAEHANPGPEVLEQTRRVFFIQCAVAATNIVVRKAWMQMLLLVYAAVILLCFITFRSWRAVVVAVVPLARIILNRWPSSPNPVTSVAAVTPAASACRSSVSAHSRS